MVFAGQSYSGPWVDSDNDGIPDFADPYPNDPNNNTAWWPGGTFLINGQWPTLPAQYHRANAGDADGDGIPDDLDPYPNDPWNGTYFTWPSQPTSFVINDETTWFNPTTYAGLYVDSDGDGIPDVADPYPNDANNHNRAAGNGGCNCGHGGCLGRSCPGVNDPAHCTCQNPGATDNSGPDSDGDGMSDSYEIANGLNPNLAADAADAPMGDSVFNVEKAQHALATAMLVSDAALYLQITGHDQSWLNSQLNDPTKSIAENDWDGDGISNIDELLVFHTDPRDPTSQPTVDQIRQALSEGKCSLTTRANYFWMLTDGGGTGSNGTGIGGNGTGVTGAGGTGAGGTGTGSTGSGGAGTGGTGTGGTGTGGTNSPPPSYVDATSRVPFLLKYNWTGLRWDQGGEPQGHWDTQVILVGYDYYATDWHYDFSDDTVPPPQLSGEPYFLNSTGLEGPDKPPDDAPPPYWTYTEDLAGYYPDGVFAEAHYRYTKQSSDPGSTPVTLESQDFGGDSEPAYLDFASYWYYNHPGKIPPLITYQPGDSTTWRTYDRRERYVHLDPVWVDEPPSQPGWVAINPPDNITDRGAVVADGQISERSAYFKDNTGEWHKGTIAIEWDPNWPWPLTDDDKEQWLSSYYVLTQTTTYDDSGSPSEPEVSMIPLRDVIIDPSQAGATNDFQSLIATAPDRLIAAGPDDPTGYEGSSKSKEVYLVSVAFEIPDVDHPDTISSPVGDYVGYIAESGTNPASSASGGSSSQPTDFTNSRYKTAPELRVAKMEDSLTPDPENRTRLHIMTPANDPDNFRVAVRGLPAGGSHFIMLAAVDASGKNYTDGPKKVDLFDYSKFRSDMQFWGTPCEFLVSDDEDNKVPIRRRAMDGTMETIWPDNPLRSALSLKVKLGGKVVVQSLGNGDNTPVALPDRRCPVNIKKTITVYVDVLADVSPDTSTIKARAKADIDDANERFAQVGVQLILGGDIKVVGLPPGIEDSYIQFMGKKPATAQQVQIENLLQTSDEAHDMHVFYVIKIKPSNASDGIAYGFGGDGLGGSKNKIFMSTADSKVYTLAHEIGHRATRKGHYGGTEDGDYPAASDIKRAHNLMQPGGAFSREPWDAKRFYQIQENFMFGRTQ